MGFGNSKYCQFAIDTSVFLLRDFPHCRWWVSTSLCFCTLFRIISIQLILDDILRFFTFDIKRSKSFLICFVLYNIQWTKNVTSDNNRVSDNDISWIRWFDSNIFIRNLVVNGHFQCICPCPSQYVACALCKNKMINDSYYFIDIIHHFFE